MNYLLAIRSTEDHTAAIERLFVLLPCLPGSEADSEARLLQLAVARYERDAARAAALKQRGKLN
ncbi:hypothetical protein ABIE41_000422 [Bosea sp. OAE506]|uniref:hypothetical protein n=1 Tax=Bosea sp. OAE506 TaxID=2663870 RepID=UPI001789E877